MQILEGLDPAQLEAVLSPAMPLCILAGAGSGKTRVLTRRIAHRIATGTADGDHVLAVTFTRRAAGDLRSRIGALGVRERVAAGTFHAVAYAQLRQRWADRGIREPVLLEHKQRLLGPLMSDGPTGDEPLALVTEIEWAKARMVTPAGYEAAADLAGRRPPISATHMAEVYDRYETEKRRRGLVDFEDLLIAAAIAFETDAEYAAAQRWRFRHLFVDEFQDVNPAQFRLLQAWLGGRLDLCVVGDPHQAIYAWNGSDPRLLTDIASHFPAVEIVRLDTNYRSTPQVVAVARTALERTDAPRPARPEGEPPTIRRYDTDGDEVAGIVRGLRDAHRPGVPWSHLAVLTRTNAQLRPIEESLRAAGIPHRSRRGGVLDDPDARAALRALRAMPGAAPLRTRLVDLEEEAEEATDERRHVLLELVRLGHEHLALDTGASPESFATWLRATARADDTSGRVDAVTLATFHAAKGLEWPVVFVGGLERGLVPIGHATTAGARAEERRLLYVALTRAEDRLHCSWAARRVFGSRSIGRAPSPWLAAIESAVDGMVTPLGPPPDWRERLAGSRATLRAMAPARHVSYQ